MTHHILIAAEMTTIMLLVDQYDGGNGGGMIEFTENKNPQIR